MPTCLVALGSNLGHRQSALQGAVASFSAHEAVQVVAQSSWHRTAPVGGPADQSEFVNGAVRLETDLPPSALLTLLQQIETAHGRERHERWAARSLDLDLLLYGEQVIETPDLIVPHPRMSFRRFVLEPAAEVAADLRHPQIGWTIGQLLHHLDTAEHYLAVTGPPGVGKTRLARRLHQHFGGKLIQDRPLRQQDDPDGSQSPSRRIEFFHQRVAMLEPPKFEKGNKSFVVSDCWLGESLAARIASSMLAADDIATAGPNSSWQLMRIPASTSATSVGS